MKIERLKEQGGSRLLLCMAGWSAVPELFGALEAEEGQDVWVGYDYRDLTFDADLSRYETVDLVAWSLGVWVAGQLFADRTFRSATAINGTGLPVDDTCGIPPAVFRATLEHVTADGMARFNRRMCGSREVLATYQQHPARPVSEIEAELHTLYNSIISRKAAEIRWTRAIISEADRIFPAANQRAYWEGRCPLLLTLDAPHYPFYVWKQWKEITG